MELTEEDKALLMCAFEVKSVRCNQCINGEKCSDGDFFELGQDLLVKIGIIKYKD